MITWEHKCKLKTKRKKENNLAVFNFRFTVIEAELQIVNWKKITADAQIYAERLRFFLYYFFA